MKQDRTHVDDTQLEDSLLLKIMDRNIVLLVVIGMYHLGVVYIHGDSFFPFFFFKQTNILVLVVYNSNTVLSKNSTNQQ